MASIDVHELAKYPFLEEARKHFGEADLAAYLQSNTGRMTAHRGAERLSAAIRQAKPTQDLQAPKVEVYTYVLARVIASALGNRLVTARLVDYEVARIAEHLATESRPVYAIISDRLDHNADARELSVVTYVNLTCKINNPALKLINRSIERGMVKVSADENAMLLTHALRREIDRKLPMRVPSNIVALLQPLLDRVLETIAEKTAEEYGEICDSAFPPCVREILHSAQTGGDISHAARFFVVAFLREIGMTETQIVTIFSVQPGFNLEMTTYQVNHIVTGEYTAQACATLTTHGICRKGADPMCSKVKHPLRFYKLKKRVLDKNERAQAKKAASVVGAE